MVAVADLATAQTLLAKYQAAKALSDIFQTLTADGYFIFNATTGRYDVPAGPPFTSYFKLLYRAPGGTGDAEEFILDLTTAQDDLAAQVISLEVQLEFLGVDPLS